MEKFIEKNRKTIFFIIILCSYVCALAFNCLTPYLSDDYAYMMELRDNGVSSILDVCKLAYSEYFQHGGRILHYFTFRLFLFLPSKFIFNAINSLFFVSLGVLVYLNVEKKKKWDLGVLLLSFGLEWLLAIYPGQTMFWLTGSVVYLFAIVYILGSVTLYRYFLNRDSIKCQWGVAILMFVISLFAGNSSENNSAAAIVILFIVTLSKYFGDKKINRDKMSLRLFVKPYIVTTFIGYIIGYLALILSPGTWNRASVMSEEDYSGFVGILSHIYKIMVALKELFLPMLIVISLLLTILVVCKKLSTFNLIINNSGVLWLIAAFVGSFSLAAISPPMHRAYFGVSIFLIISMITLMQDVGDVLKSIEVGKIVKYAAVSICCVLFVFIYLENLVNLARIYRESGEQTAIMEQAISAGETQYVEVPQLHEDFDNKYTIAYFPQIDSDSAFWINTFYEGWYGIDKISAVPREIWDAKH